MVSSEQEIESLARRAGEGDRRAFEALLTAIYRRIFRMAYRVVENREDAEEITQESCVRLARSMEKFRGESAFTTWLYRIVMNAIHDFQRQMMRTRNNEVGEEALADMASPHGNPEDGLLARLIRRCVAALPEGLRQAVLLVHGEGLAHRQAGLVLECAEGTISWRLSEARKQLALCLGREKQR